MYELGITFHQVAKLSGRGAPQSFKKTAHNAQFGTRLKAPHKTVNVCCTFVDSS